MGTRRMEGGVGWGGGGSKSSLVEHRPTAAWQLRCFLEAGMQMGRDVASPRPSGPLHRRSGGRSSPGATLQGGQEALGRATVRKGSSENHFRPLIEVFSEVGGGNPAVLIPTFIPVLETTTPILPLPYHFQTPPFLSSHPPPPLLTPLPLIFSSLPLPAPPPPPFLP